MPIVYANIHQSIYCSRLTHLPSCLGYFHKTVLIYCTVIGPTLCFFYFAPRVRQSDDIKRAENRLSCKYGQYRLYLKFNVGAARQEIGMFKISDAAGDLGIPGEGGDNSNTDIKCKC